MKCHQNHAGEFIRRYSPIGMGYGAWGVGRWRTNDVGANHAGEFIRRYSPIGCASANIDEGIYNTHINSFISICNLGLSNDH